MMKIYNSLLCIIVCLLAISVSNAQLNIDPETKKVLYQETVVVDSLNKEQLYERAIYWMTIHFKTNKFDLNDKTDFKISHEGDFLVSYTYDFKYKSENNITFNFTLNIKDGKYRYTITDFKIYDIKLGAKTAQPLELAFQKMKTETKKEFSNKFDLEVNNLIQDLKAGIVKKQQEEEESWD